MNRLIGETKSVDSICQYIVECKERCMNGGKPSCHCKPVMAVRNRLAEYEDSNLTPAEVAELVQAKADGRVVVLKAGDEK